MKALVTGGGGFLGGEIVKQLVARGDQVRVLARGKYPFLQALGVEAFQGDIRVLQDVLDAARGVDVIFHVAARAGVWGPPQEFENINVGGTRNVLMACQQLGIVHMVHTSSPSVVQHGGDQEGVDESTGYPQTFLADYPRTKAAAEQLVLAANGLGIKTVALRPHLIWGPGDPHILPRLVKQARAGQLRKIGNRDPLIDAVYVENAAAAHLLACDKLRAGAPVDGKVYFVTNGEPMGAWTLINKLLDAAGAPPITRSVPAWAAILVGTVLEKVYRFQGREDEPRLTRFVAKELSTAHWFSIEAARRDLGYEPKVSMEEGLKRLKRFHQEGQKG